MVVLQIEHRVPNFEGWKKVFDSDPIGRKKMGVKRYRIHRTANDPNYVIIDLEFDNVSDAEKTLDALKKLWESAEGKVMMNPAARIFVAHEAGDV